MRSSRLTGGELQPFVGSPRLPRKIPICIGRTDSSCHEADAQLPQHRGIVTCRHERTTFIATMWRPWWQTVGCGKPEFGRQMDSTWTPITDLAWGGWL